jgi:lipoyl(octanoyl) transferase
MVEWRISDAPVEYPEALAWMEARVDAIRAGRARECVWLLEHPALYTAGTSARPEELVDAGRLPVYPARRGGRYTYHGPGQRVAYVMLDLEARGRDLRRFVHALEGWVIAALADFQVRGERREGRVGVWVGRPDKAPGPVDAAENAAGKNVAEDKIAAIGVRVRRWVTFHGVSINVEPDLDHYHGIVPCGISGHGSGYGVTSLVDLGLPVTLADLDVALRRRFEGFFPTAGRLPASAEPSCTGTAPAAQGAGQGARQRAGQGAE